jgi:outer membrane PBP1 activator LpoA protein
MLQFRRVIMQTVVPAFIPRLAILILAVAAAACAPGPTAPDTTAYQARAESLEAAGDHLAAAEEWQSVAEMSAGSARDRAYLRAARNLIAAGRPAEARRTLEGIAAAPAGPDAIEFALLYASSAVATGDPVAALEKLDRLPPDLEGRALAHALRLRGEALFDLGRGAPAVETLVRRELILTSSADIADNRRFIWNRLQEAATAGADLSTPPGAGPDVAGWLELGRILQVAGGNPFRMRGSLEGWRETHPEHPASLTVLDAILANFQALTAYPSKVALILPLEGPLASSARAVRDGFVAAHFEESGDRRPEILILDTARLGATAAWERAAEQGADFIVGPLSKDEVGQLAGVSGGIPTLALNEPAGDIPLPGFIFQFPLAPEDEAAQAARRILADGLYRGVAMVPANDWGMRIAESFGDALQSGGGRLLEVRTYVSGLPDYSDEITALLHVDDSRSRHQRLESALGVNLAFEPRRRQDTEFIFLAALPRDGKQIAPQFRFHYAFDLPVYATSSIYLPGERPGTDLDGVQFDDMPWILLEDDTRIAALRERIGSVWPAATGRRARLYALGFDAYTLVPLLRGSSSGAMSELQALSGTLYLTGSGRVARRLEWARVVNGEVRSGASGNR